MQKFWMRKAGMVVFNRGPISNFRPGIAIQRREAKRPRPRCGALRTTRVHGSRVHFGQLVRPGPSTKSTKTEQRDAKVRNRHHRRRWHWTGGLPGDPARSERSVRAGRAEFYET